MMKAKEPLRHKPAVFVVAIALGIALGGCLNSERRAEKAEAEAEHAQAAAARAEEAASKALEASQAATVASENAAKAVAAATKSINETAARMEEMQREQASRPRHARKRIHATASAAPSPAALPEATASPAR
jgi:hypothetical protein